MRHFRDVRVSLVCCLALLGACKVGPDYVPPELRSPDAWTEEIRNGVLQGPTDLKEWWTKFNDPVLSNLIQRCDTGNLDLGIAMARIRESRAALGIARADRLPSVAGTASANLVRNSANNPFFPPGISANTTDVYSAGFDATWEIDVWGRISRNVASANAGLGAQYEDYRDTRVILYAEVARNYMDLRAFQRRIKLARDNVKTQKDSLVLAEQRLEAGVAPALDVAQAKTNLGSTESLIPSLEQGKTAAILRIAVLLGVHPGAVRKELEKAGEVPTPPSEVHVGVPADLIRQRPDIRAAERRLAAQTEQIGVATAELYPQFSLSGFFGLQSGSLSNLFSSNSVTWGMGFPIRWRIFEGGRIRSEIEVQEARTEQALKIYEQTVLLAIEEIEGSINRFTQEQDRRDALRRAVAAAQESVTLSIDLYRQGLVDFQNVLDSQRSLLSFQDAMAESEGAVAANLVAVYKALGGGWRSMEPPPETPEKGALAEEPEAAEPETAEKPA